VSAARKNQVAWAAKLPGPFPWRIRHIGLKTIAGALRNQRGRGRLAVAMPIGLAWMRLMIAKRRINIGEPRYAHGVAASLDLWLLDLRHEKGPAPPHTFAGLATMRSFGTSLPTGKHIVFDRLRDNSDVVLISCQK